MNGLNRRTVATSIVLVGVIGIAASADDPAVETVLTGLQAPRGVAVRPGAGDQQYEVFVSDTAAGRIVKLSSNQPGKSTDAVTGFLTRADRGQNAGPFGLLFLDRDHLIVACGSDPAIRIFELSDQTEPQVTDKLQQQVGDSDVESAISLTRTRANDVVPDLLVVTCASRDRSKQLAKIPVRAGTLDKLSPFVAGNSSAHLDPPIGVAVSQHGFIAVAQTDSTSETLQSRITFLNPIDGSAVLAVPVGLADVFGLAYHPQSGNLYAIDFAPNDEKQGGVFRIDDTSMPGKPACRATRIAAIVRPTALAFGPDGALYVTTANKSNGAENNPGTLLRITGDL